MLAAANRLKSHREITRTQRMGQFTPAGSLHVRALSSGRDYSRAVIVVSKKISNKATVRNRTRRRLAAALAEQWQTVLPGYDIVLIVRGDLAGQAAPEIKTVIKSALNKANLT